MRNLRLTWSTLVLFLALVPGQHAMADNLLGLYFGGALGQSQLEAGIPTVGAPFGTYNFKENHSAYKVMVGVRPISLLGAEFEYMDLGHPTSSVGTMTNDVSIKGSGVFALLYLPIPVIDVFVKAGFARLQTSSTSYDPQVNCGIAPNPNCPYTQWHDTSTDVGAGAGVQFKLLSWAMRGEYEQFHAAGGYPKLLSIGVTYTF